MTEIIALFVGLVIGWNWPMTKAKEWVQSVLDRYNIGG